MKILVNNEREKELFQEFVTFLSDYADSEEMIELMKKANYSFESHEIDFLQTGLWQSTVTIDKKVWDITIPSDNLTGICRYCGGEWHGIEDVSEVDIYEYERFLNLDKEDSYHAECLRENQCTNCGSDDEEVFEGEYGLVCKSCKNDVE